VSVLRFILGDQLSRSISSLDGLDSEADVVLMAEVRDEARYVRHHRQKIVLVFSAMRHFAQALRDEGVRVDYVTLDDPSNSGSLGGELERALARSGCGRVVVTEPGEWRVREQMRAWETGLNIPVEVRQDRRFLCSTGEFADWASGRKSLRMEYFYRQMRRKTGWLMDGDRPEGGRWNYDAENRKRLPAGISLPLRRRFEPDETTRAVIERVSEHFGDHFGALDGFGWPVSREQALEALGHFVEECLPAFGDYQDAMKSGEDYLFHALVSPALNLGLLEPREVCEAVLGAYAAGLAPLAATEGFLRQVLGWREYVRGLYWLLMPDYADSNYLGADRPLPAFFWTAETPMNCIRETVEATRRNAYAHHIQRLMVTGNFALLAGLAPAEVEQWYLAVYADAYEWVELPNTHGMALFADGGVLASKPYAASGAYINRMSDYCKHCAYDPKARDGDAACPFNYLYWHFLMVNADQLSSNPRMGLAYRNLERLSETQRWAIRQRAQDFLDKLSA
jgi:deoxyribodipyrimidine photolyase-related protein